MKWGDGMYTVIKAFTCRDCGIHYLQGETYNNSKPERIHYLVNLGYIEAATEFSEEVGDAQ